MAAVLYNFFIEQSSDFSINFQYLDANGVGVDLSSACIKLRYLTNLNQGGIFTNGLVDSIKPTLYNSYGYSLTGDAFGLVQLKLSSNLTSTYNFETAVYDLDVQIDIDDGAGNIRTSNTRLSTGTITIVKKNFLGITDCNVISTDPIVPPTPTPTPTGITPTPTPTPENPDLCFPECSVLDIMSIVYSGSGINIPDATASASGLASSSISNVYDSRNIENIELAINGLNHSSPQDLIWVVSPPSGDPILLSMNNKISNYTSNFNFMFSNKAISGVYLNNVSNNGYCNIIDKTDILKYTSTLNSGFDHLFGASLSGNWTLHGYDTDIGASGSIASWKLIITYAEE